MSACASSISWMSGALAFLCPLLLLVFMVQAAAGMGTVMDVVVGGFRGDSIALGALDGRNGSLKLTSYSTAAGPHPDFVAWLRKGDALFGLVANEAGSEAAITALQMQRQPGGGLKAVRTASLRVDDPCHVAVHPAGRWAFTASYPAGTVTVIELIHVTSFQEGAGPAPAAAAPTAQAAARPAAPGSPWLLLRKASVLPTTMVGEAAHQVALAGAGGRFVYVPCLKSDYVRVFAFDAATGSLAPLPSPSPASIASSQSHQQRPPGGRPAAANNSSVSAGSNPKPPAGSGSAVAGDNSVRLPPGSGPRHILLHPALPVAYVLCELSSTIARFDWDSDTGQLQADFGSQPGRVVSMLPPNSSCSSNSGARPGACSGRACLQAGAELVVSGDGRWLYASNRGMCGGVNNIAIFAVAMSDGSLTAVGWEDGGGDVNFPRHMSLTPEDTFLLVANQQGGSVTVFSRDAASGRLRRVSTVPAAATDGSAAVVEPAFVAVVPV